ncbi:ABC transporter permease [Methylocaldum marinum]|uniref:ABC transporter permease n=1 Tax=Methylocaldum marinum TaxID=1432792 RepID=A0A250KP62_9GAMM|nr:sugar ABC transporter permease [Methylocaldum marinum]BBA33336.1 ABC transporter permease [Methylocaldum marinum]
MRRAQNLKGWLLCAPALSAMALVTAYPVFYAVRLSLYRYDLRHTADPDFVALRNYFSVLSSEVWWQALWNTLLITTVSVFFELVLGFALALLMHRAVFGRSALRSAVLVPYAIITVVAALAWKFAFDPTTGFVNSLFGIERAWLNEHWSAFAVIIFSEVWKTTPFMALLLLAGLSLIPDDVLKAAKVDGASAVQRFRLITLPLVKPSILVALLFRSLDAFRIFDSVYVLTRGAHGTESVSVIGYNTLIVRLNLGLGSAVSVLIFSCTLAIALLFIKGFGTPLLRKD